MLCPHTVIRCFEGRSEIVTLLRPASSPPGPGAICTRCGSEAYGRRWMVILINRYKEDIDLLREQEKVYQNYAKRYYKTKHVGD